jgi:hypothetical protein
VDTTRMRGVFPSLTEGDGGAVSIMSDEVRQEDLHRTHNLLQIWNVIGSIANLLTDFLVFGQLLLEDNSFVWTPPWGLKVGMSMLGTHHKKPYVSLHCTSGGDPSPLLARGFPVTANIKTIRPPIRSPLTASPPWPTRRSSSITTKSSS